MAATGRAAASRAVIFDHSTLLVDDAAVLVQLRAVLTKLRDRGVKLVSFSTHSQDMPKALEKRGLPPVDLFVTRDDVGANKGSPKWIEFAAERLGIRRHRLFYVGDDHLDWKTAINAGILFVHAKWSKQKADKVTALTLSSPDSAYRFMTHFFLPGVRWGYRMDEPKRGLHVRSLLNASCVLPCDDPHKRFTLQDVFTYENKRLVGNLAARDLLMIHVISNLCTEGLITSGTRFAVYPSSGPGVVNETFTEFLGPAAKFFHGWMQEAMLVRKAPAPDTSKLRAAKRHGEVGFHNQCNTVVVNEELATHYLGKQVIVFDDFTTSGMSLDWARTLLRAAGAERVVLVTFGKYGKRTPLYHSCYEPAEGITDPYHLADYPPTAFLQTNYPFTEDAAGMQLTQELFQLWKEKRPYEP